VIGDWWGEGLPRHTKITNHFSPFTFIASPLQFFASIYL
jgi:hypothetical protein